MAQEVAQSAISECNLGTDPGCVKDQPKNSSPLELVGKALKKPLAVVICYLFSLRLILQESGDVGLPTVFQECSWIPPAVTTCLYLIFVFAGKAYMAKREAFEVSHYMVTYNLYQSLLNIWGAAAIISEVFQQGFSFWGNHYDESRNGYRLAMLLWIHYNNKYVELLDTVFMVVRKKNKQISFLHCFHHCLLIWSWWVVKTRSGW
jgi:hypothetical protein